MVKGKNDTNYSHDFQECKILTHIQHHRRKNDIIFLADDS